MKSIELEKLVNSPDVTIFEGTEGCFMPIDEKWGVKFFNYEDTRDNSLEWQSHYYNLDLAPMVGPKVSFWFEGETWYGFLTERCSPCDEAVLEYFGEYKTRTCSGADYFTYCAGYSCTDYDSNGEPFESDYIEAFFRHNPEWAAKYDILVSKLRQHRISWNDDHAGNWGLNTKDEPVILDFGRATSHSL